MKKMDEEVASPCTKVCAVDERTGFCVGCLRTLNEIAGWGSLGNADKREILDRIAVRRKSVRQTQQERPKE